MTVASNASRSRPTTPPASEDLPSLSHRYVLGMRVDATSYDDASARVLAWSSEQRGRYVCVANVHMAMEAHDDPDFQALVNDADLVTPDGMPLVWALSALGVDAPTRVSGPDLLLSVCAASAAAGVPVGFHGGSPAALEGMLINLRRSFPELEVAYASSPPFHQASAEEAKATIEAIVTSGARVLFVGLGCPKQERWMAAHRDLISAVQLGVGAAFDFHAGLVRRAPDRLQRLGLEWAYRLAMEPRRLFRRYARHNPRFMWYLLRQILASRRAG